MNPSSSNIIKHKAAVETVFEVPNRLELYAPREDSKSNLYVCSRAGEVIKFNEKGDYQVLFSLPGQPSCIAFENKEEIKSQESQKDNLNNNSGSELGETFYISDVANSLIYCKKTTNTEETNVLVKDYEGYPLKGPTSLAINNESNSILFCDGGYFEATSLNNPTGSLFSVELDTQNIQPILLNCLSYPSDIFFDNIIGIGYVSETFSNRLLRITENPQGVYHASVFYCFNGRLGPSSVACDDEGNVYVSRFEYQNKEGSVDGLISVINKEGILIGEIQVPKMSEITGMYIPRRFYDESKEGEAPKIPQILYFTERNFNGVKKIKLQQFRQEIEKL